MVSIDRAGRIVVPKDLREVLGLNPGAELSIEIVGDGLRLTPLRPRPRRVIDVDGWPVIEAAAGRTTSDADVQRWRDADQR
jgi:AbrB family looped-hinge helix DNA binding protein